MASHPSSPNKPRDEDEDSGVSLKGSKGSKHKKINRKHPEFELTYDMMLGIRTTVGQIESKPHKLKLDAKDMQRETSLRFPGQGSTMTPAHQMRDFKFKDYAPEVFREIRARFGINPSDYLLCLCGNFQYLEFISNSKSGQFFFYSHDRRYMIKTIAHAESKFLRKILPDYYEHLMKYPNTLLARFLGMHRVKPHKKKEVHFLIMGSVFYTRRVIHQTFDLKGSRQGRNASAKDKASPSCVYKDNDFLEQKCKIQIGYARAKLLNDQIAADCEFLQGLGIMDYSLLLGINDLSKLENQEEKTWQMGHQPQGQGQAEPAAPGSGAAMALELSQVALSEAEPKPKPGAVAEFDAAWAQLETYVAEDGVTYYRDPPPLLVEWAQAQAQAQAQAVAEEPSQPLPALPDAPQTNQAGDAEPSAHSSSGSRSGSEPASLPALPASAEQAAGTGAGAGTEPGAGEKVSASGYPDWVPPAYINGGAKGGPASVSELVVVTEPCPALTPAPAPALTPASAPIMNGEHKQPASGGSVSAPATPLAASRTLDSASSLSTISPASMSLGPVLTPAAPNGLGAASGQGQGQGAAVHEPAPWELNRGDFQRRQTRYGLPNRYDQFSTPQDANFIAPEFAEAPVIASAAAEPAMGHGAAGAGAGAVAGVGAEGSASPHHGDPRALIADSPAGGRAGAGALPSPAHDAKAAGHTQPVVSIFAREDGGTRGLNGEGEWTNQVYYMGIIDILTEYGIKKKLENKAKLIKYSKNDISAIEPAAYAERFKKFMSAAIC